MESGIAIIFSTAISAECLFSMKRVYGSPINTNAPQKNGMEYFEDLSASGGLKFEPVEAKRRSRSSGMQ